MNRRPAWADIPLLGDFSAQHLTRRRQAIIFRLSGVVRSLPSPAAFLWRAVRNPDGPD
jgi:hypothetical protein